MLHVWYRPHLVMEVMETTLLAELVVVEIAKVLL
jgi:hypothetical protein